MYNPSIIVSEPFSQHFFGKVWLRIVTCSFTFLPSFRSLPQGVSDRVIYLIGSEWISRDSRNLKMSRTNCCSLAGVVFIAPDYLALVFKATNCINPPPIDWYYIYCLRKNFCYILFFIYFFRFSFCRSAQIKLIHLFNLKITLYI